MPTAAIRRPWTLGALAVAVFLTAGLLALTRAAASENSREVTLRVKGMAFYVDGVAAANPTLTFAPGERVRLVLINEDHGFRHNLVIPALDVHTAIVEAGQREGVTVTVPAAPGRHSYTCEPHAAMMRGNITIE